jgi:hypothetical protein
MLGPRTDRRIAAPGDHDDRQSRQSTILGGEKVQSAGPDPGSGKPCDRAHDRGQFSVEE